MARLGNKIVDELVWILVLGRFQNSSVPVLILSTHSVPVSTSSTKILTFCSGFSKFGSSVMTVLLFGIKMPNFLQDCPFLDGITIWFSVKLKLFVKIMRFWRNSMNLFWLNFIENADLAILNQFSVKFAKNGCFGYPRFLNFGSGSRPVSDLYRDRFYFGFGSQKIAKNRRFLGFG